MSRILWTHSVTPGAEAPVEDRVYEVYDPTLVVRRTRAIPEPNRRLVELPDRRAYRSLSRAGVLLSAAGLPAREVLAPFLERDRYRVGIYCAADPGPQNYRGARELLDERDGFAEGFRRHNHPKVYFTQLANLPPAQLAIFLDLRGPVNVYKHSRAAALHALEQAELDLATDLVDAALLCAAFSLEDPLLCLRERRSAPEAVLSEGAGALVLVAGGEPTDWSRFADEAGDVCYGVADLILTVSLRENSIRKEFP
jgi:hypothetical protein